MAAASFGALASVSSSNLLLGLMEAHGDSVREKKSGGTYDQKPEHLYLIYISLDKDGLVVRHLWKDIKTADVDLEEDSLISSAKSGNSQAVNFETIRFTKKSFLTIILDYNDWEFYYPDPTSVMPDYFGVHDPIVFLDKKTAIVYENGKWIKKEDAYVLNKAFYDCQLLTKKVNVSGQYVDRQAIRCINYRTKNDAGEYPGNTETLHYGFNIFLRVPFSISAPARKITVILDPDGQNLGPYP